MKKFKLAIFLVVTTCLLLIINNYSISVNAYYQESNSAGRGMIVIDGESGEIFYGKNIHEQMPMASTTKIITAIVAIENCDNIQEKFLISDNAVGIEGTSMYLKSGEMLSMEELLYGLMLASGNDCAVAIAEYFGGEDVFVGMMNELVKNLGLVNTHFDNPHGLDSESHYTSPYDLATLTSYALKNHVFRKFSATERMVIEPTNQYQARYLKHKNKLLFEDDSCIGVKTGFTDNAGRCLVNACEKNNMQIISVVLNCQPMFDECRRLTQMVVDNYHVEEFIKPYSFVSNVNLNSSNKVDIGVIAIEGFKKPILNCEIDCYEVKYNLPDSITAPIRLNEVVGSVDVIYNGEVIYTGDLITIEDAENNDMKYLLDNIIDQWF